MKNKNYRYFFLILCVCTAYGGDNSAHTLSTYDDTDRAYKDFFEDGLSVKSASLSKKNHKNKKKRKGRADLVSDDLTAIQETLKSPIAAQLQHVLSDVEKVINKLAGPLVKAASRRLEDSLTNDAYIAQMNVQSKVIPEKNDSQERSMPKKFNKNELQNTADTNLKNIKFGERVSSRSDNSSTGNRDSEISYPSLPDYPPNNTSWHPEGH
jgi:hypothetical protein